MITSFDVSDLLRLSHPPESHHQHITPADDVNDKHDKLHNLIVSRTILAAVKNGHLKRLPFSRHPIQDVGAIRALVPLWLQVDHWELYFNYHTPEYTWQAAASELRPLLSHISLWLKVADADEEAPRRLLTGAEMQAFSAHFIRDPNGDAPPTPQLTARSIDCDGCFYEGFGIKAIVLYLRWFEEDAALAQQVADAWNVIVRRGEADRVRCYGAECDARWEYRIVKTVLSDGSTYAHNETVGES